MPDLVIAGLGRGLNFLVMAMKTVIGSVSILNVVFPSVLAPYMVLASLLAPGMVLASVLATSMVVFSVVSSVSLDDWIARSVA